MTIALGINFGDYVLLAADTRVTYQFWGAKIGYRDDREKIQKTSMGIITGAGSVDLLDAVKDRLAEKQIVNSDEVFEAVKEERLRLLNLGIINQDFVSMTGWLFSYMTVVDDKPKLRLDLVHPSLAEGSVRWEENKLAIIFPIEIEKNQADGIANELNELVKPSSKFSSINESFQYHCAIARELIKLIQPDCPSVSRFYQFGVHTIHNQVEISKIFSVDS